MDPAGRSTGGVSRSRTLQIDGLGRSRKCRGAFGGTGRAGGRCASVMVYEGVRHKLDVGFTDLGERSVKSIAAGVVTLKHSVTELSDGLIRVRRQR